MRVMYGIVADCYVLVLKSKRWPRKRGNAFFSLGGARGKVP
jgi:hypothetical protein